MAFKSLSIDAKTRYVTGVTSFSGMDVSNQRFQVSQSRAIDLNNFIYKEGIIQKREGIEEILHIEPTYYRAISIDEGEPEDASTYVLTSDLRINDTNINGIWSVTGEDNKLHIIAHIGKLLYEIFDIDKETISIKPITTSSNTTTYNGHVYVYAYEFENYKSSAFVGSKRLYFLGGNKFMCIKFEKDNLGNTIRKLYPVEDDEDTYIPTTTTSISYKHSAVSNQASLDDVNLLTQWRKNELISGTLKDEDEKTQTAYYDYTLDAPLICKSGDDMYELSDFEIILKEEGTIE